MRSQFNDLAKRDQLAKTPDKLMSVLNKEFGFSSFDPCPANRDPTFDGLTVDWGKPGETVYINPPYENLKPWVMKACEERDKGVTVVGLFPVRTHTQWFQDYVFQEADEIRFLQGCLKFEGYQTRCPFGSCIVVYKGRHGHQQHPPPRHKIRLGNSAIYHSNVVY